MKKYANTTLVLKLGTERTLLKGDHAAVVTVDGFIERDGYKEYHRVWFSPTEWDSIATAETVVRRADRLEVTGTLEVPESGEPHHYTVAAKPEYHVPAYDQGLIRHPTITGFTPAAETILVSARIQTHEKLLCYVLKK